MYQFSSRIRFSETDIHRRLEPAALLDYFQDCVTFHCEDIGLPHAKLLAEGRFWVLNAWNVIISRLPELGERVNIITNPYDFKGCFGKRNFRMETTEGETLVLADSLWTLLGTENGAPVSCSAEEIALYAPEPAFDMDYAGRKIKIAGEPEAEFEPVPVSREMIDYNGHVNNCQYVRLAMHYLATEQPPRQLRVEYKKAALPGDTLYLQRWRDGERQILSMSDAEGKAYALVELR